jgi:phage terminase large subunit-like protein
MSGGAQENYGKPHDSRSQGRDFVQGPPEYEAEVLTTRSRSSVLRNVDCCILFTMMKVLSGFVCRLSVEGEPHRNSPDI